MVSNLGGLVEGLSHQVAGLRVEISHVDHRRRRNLIWLIPVALLAIYAIFQQASFERLSQREHERSLALAVGVCAMQNVVRIEFGNFLAEATNEGVFDLPAAVDGDQTITDKRRLFLTESKDKFTLVPCEALVAKDDIKIELRYPSTVPVTRSAAP